jgi:hypothetical protein
MEGVPKRADDCFEIYRLHYYTCQPRPYMYTIFFFSPIEWTNIHKFTYRHKTQNQPTNQPAKQCSKQNN